MNYNKLSLIENNHEKKKRVKLEDNTENIVAYEIHDMIEERNEQ